MEHTEHTKYGIRLTVNKPPADELRVHRLELRLGYRLPEDYREFLLHYNGGQPEPSSFRFALRTGPDASSCVSWFLSLYDGKHSNLERNIDIFEGRIPTATLPIADDPFGNVVLLGLHGQIRGKVYFWDHECEPEEQPSWANVDLVADSFEDFMRGLTDTSAD